MKSVLFLLFAFFTVLAFATKPLPPEKSSLSYKSLPCKQKILPLKIDYDVKNDVAFIRITSEDDILDFSVKKARGLDGLNVTSTILPPTQNFQRENTIEFEVAFTKPEGLTYLTLDLQGIVGNSLKKQSLPIPIGEISQKQKSLRTKNIRTMPGSLEKKSPQNIDENKEEKFNMMNLE